MTNTTNLPPTAWLHELMGEHDFTLPVKAFNAIAEALASTPAAPSEPECGVAEDVYSQLSDMLAPHVTDRTGGLPGSVVESFGMLLEHWQKSQPSAKPAVVAAQERHIEDTQHWTPEPAGAGEAMVTRESAVGALHHMTHGNVPGRFNEAISMLNPPRCDGGTTPAAHAGLTDADTLRAGLQLLGVVTDSNLSETTRYTAEKELIRLMHRLAAAATTPAPVMVVAPEAEHVVDEAWKDFTGLMASEDAREARLRAAMLRLDKEGPLPGMIAAFENQFGQNWTDRDWRQETSVWACAWRAAIATPLAAQGAPVACDRHHSFPMCGDPNCWRHELEGTDVAALTDDQIDDIAEPFVTDLGGDHWHSGERGIKDGHRVVEFARAVIAAATLKGQA